MFARNIKHIENHKSIIHNADVIAEIRENIKSGDVYIAKNVFDVLLLKKIKEYLIGIGKNSLPNYLPIELGCPNFHRLNQWDPRSYVKACFHQFVFFPWNQDVFKLFELSRDVYRMKNLLGGIPMDKYLGTVPEEGCISRLAFQFYPKGNGGLNKHQDPVDYHQLTAPILIMSKKGIDFREGGAYVEKSNGDKVYVDEVADIGDVVYFNAQTPHGVDVIDPNADPDWLSFEGRWMLLFAINKLAGNTSINNAVDLGN